MEFNNDPEFLKNMLEKNAYQAGAELDHAQLKLG